LALLKHDFQYRPISK